MTARDQLYLDLFATALEGGIGYWSSCTAYHWMIGPPADDVEQPSRDDLLGFYADIVIDEDCRENDDETGFRRIDRDAIRLGFNRAVSPEWRRRIHWSSGEPPPLVWQDDTDWDFDAGDADMIVQLGLFGKVIYG